MSDFQSHGLRGGLWSGRLLRAQAPARVLLIHQAKPVAEAELQPDGEGAWQVQVVLPVQCLSDGIQSFMLVAEDAEGAAEAAGPGPDSTHLATLSLVAGAPLETDLRAEIDLIRAELDLLKREFRRQAAN